MKRIGILVALASGLLTSSTLCGGAQPGPSSSSPQGPDIRPICGVPGYTLQTSYRFGKTVKPLPQSKYQMPGRPRR